MQCDVDARVEPSRLLEQLGAPEPAAAFLAARAGGTALRTLRSRGRVAAVGLLLAVLLL